MAMLVVTRDGRLHVLVSGTSEVCLCGAEASKRDASVFQGTYDEFRRDRVHCAACLKRLRN